MIMVEKWSNLHISAKIDRTVAIKNGFGSWRLVIYDAVFENKKNSFRYDKFMIFAKIAIFWPFNLKLGENLSH